MSTRKETALQDAVEINKKRSSSFFNWALLAMGSILTAWPPPLVGLDSSDAASEWLSPLLAIFAL